MTCQVDASLRRMYLSLHDKYKLQELKLRDAMTDLRKLSYTAPWQQHWECCMAHGWTPRNINVLVGPYGKVKIKLKPGNQFTIKSQEFDKRVVRVLTYTSEGAEMEVNKFHTHGKMTTCYRYWNEKTQCWSAK